MSAIGPNQSRLPIKFEWINNKKEQILLSCNVLIQDNSFPSTPIKRKVQGERYNIEPVNLLLKFNSVQDTPLEL